MAQGMERRVVVIFLGCLVGVRGVLFESGRFGGVSWVEPQTQSAVLLRPQVSNRPIKVPGSGPGHDKAGGCTFLGLLGN